VWHFPPVLPSFSSSSSSSHLGSLGIGILQCVFISTCSSYPFLSHPFLLLLDGKIQVALRDTFFHSPLSSGAHGPPPSSSSLLLPPPFLSPIACSGLFFAHTNSPFVVPMPPPHPPTSSSLLLLH
jgi:hypothetical protein